MNTRSAAPGWMAVSRGAALGLCSLITLNLLEIQISGTNPAENWLCSFHPLTSPLATTILAMGATSFLLFAMQPRLPAPVCLAAAGILLAIVTFCGREVWTVSGNLPEQLRIQRLSRPMGTIMIASVAIVGVLAGNRKSSHGRSSALAILFSASISVAGFFIAAIQSGSIPDSLNDTAAVVVITGFDEAAAASETLPAPVAVRVSLAADIVKQCEDRTLQIAGGLLTEPMTKLAVEEGVPEAAVTRLPELTSMRNLLSGLAQKVPADAAQGEPPLRIVVIGDDYQLARIRWLARQQGIDVTAMAPVSSSSAQERLWQISSEALKLMRVAIEPALGFLQPDRNRN